MNLHTTNKNINYKEKYQGNDHYGNNRNNQKTPDNNNTTTNHTNIQDKNNKNRLHKQNKQANLHKLQNKNTNRNKKTTKTGKHTILQPKRRHNTHQHNTRTHLHPPGKDTKIPLQNKNRIRNKPVQKGIHTKRQRIPTMDNNNRKRKNKRLHDGADIRIIFQSFNFERSILSFLR